MKSVKSAQSARVRRRFLVQGATLALAAVAYRMPAMARHKKTAELAPTAVAAPSLAELVRQGHVVPVESFFASSENFAAFLELTGAA